MSKLFKVKLTFSVPDDAEPEEFINFLADSIDEVLGRSDISYCFGFFVQHEEEQGESD